MDNQVNIHTNEPEVIVRHGNAPELPVAKRVVLAGNIAAPGAWLGQKIAAEYEFIDHYSHAVVNRDKGTIVFMSNDEKKEHGGHTITGSLLSSSEIDELGINTRKTYSAKTLGQSLKMRRTLFADRDESMRVVTELQKFKASVVKEVEENNDLRGNKLSHFEQRVKSEFDMSFNLTLAPFKGEEKVTVKVEVVFDITDGAVTYWLESPELKEAQDNVRDGIFDREIDIFIDHGVTVIEQ